MRMTKALLGFIIVLAISFIGFQIFKLDEISSIVRLMILPLLTILYYLKTKDSRSYFFYFLLCYSITEFSEILTFFDDTPYYIYQVMYYGGNGLNILAYVFMILEVLKSMNLKSIWSSYPVHIFILLALDIYSVILVSQVSVSSGYFVDTMEYVVEILYNITMMVLLTVTLINYISRDSKKAMNLLLGALCIVFSEVIQVAHYYVSEKNIFIIVYSILLVLAFGFFYIQANMNYVKEKNYQILKSSES